MNTSTRTVNIIVGVMFLYIAYDFWVDSGVFIGYFTPEPPADFGTLSAALEADNPLALQEAGKADMLSKGTELLATVLSTIGLTFIMIVTKGSSKLASIAADLWDKWQSQKTVPVNSVDAWGQDAIAQQQAILPEGQTWVKRPQLPPQQVSDIMRLLQQSIVDKKPELTIALAQELAGEEYITDSVDENGFPTEKA